MRANTRTHPNRSEKQKTIAKPTKLNVIKAIKIFPEFNTIQYLMDLLNIFIVFIVLNPIIIGLDSRAKPFDY